MGDQKQPQFGQRMTGGPVARDKSFWVAGVDAVAGDGIGLQIPKKLDGLRVNFRQRWGVDSDPVYGVLAEALLIILDGGGATAGGVGIFRQGNALGDFTGDGVGIFWRDGNDGWDGSDRTAAAALQGGGGEDAEEDFHGVQIARDGGVVWGLVLVFVFIGRVE